MAIEKRTGSRLPRLSSGKQGKDNRVVRFVDLNQGLDSIQEYTEETFVPLPTAPTTGDALIYNGTDWVAGPAGDGFTYEIGQYVPDEGGVIVHRYLENGIQNYLAIPIVDQSTSQAYSNVTNTLIGVTAQSTWDGLSNSNAIVGQAGHTASAASLCLDLVYEGKSDWYLPSIDELSLVYHNRFSINKSLSTIGGSDLFTIPNYWSSTEIGASFALLFGFISAAAVSSNKSNSTANVRAVRAFTV